MFFKRKDQNLIPPVSQPSLAPSSTRGTSQRSVSPLPSYRSNASTYVPSRDGDPYNKMTSRSNSAGANVNDDYHPPPRYNPEDAQLQKNRNELFAGYNPEKSGGSGRFFDGPPAGREPPPGEENDEDVEGIRQQTRYLKQESVNSTRNALRLAREAEETARGTLTRLGDQSEKLANTERHLDVAKGHTARAEDKTDELKQLNRSIFRPVITWNKDAKRAAKEQEIQQRYEEERSEREKAMMDIRDTQNRLGRATTYGRQDDDDEGISPGGGSSRMRTAAQLSARKEQRKRYQFEAGASDDEIEDELDDNLEEVSNVTKGLKALGMAMGQELDRQNERIEVIDGKTRNLDNRVFRNTEKLKRIK
ncbi:hypothetical protein SERLA73DRAFT_131295 [Serpula lacrymans var. lacrymans S7.3]|uniref:t-SNARE coiled-coil homology domain-containing protein n=2 Tax=Serpula lacrymans var. lacrymans TaxID=341189 RepID=F8PMR1_SERL3|nr:uncharacterized protein SERLADRAFT_380464 [Serpula lacrymans var. lacrymans S7.9]EGO02893.1 hypothetical protein SERLA73DRAFT_131295 [Serpula lacrymans var. lacrymans S7.3]EGO28585.1 hypothetical protein SERLADRAFT_380464 [Serpula lacrymans var. lacrymans S7.9]